MDLWELLVEVGNGNPLVKVSSLFSGRAFIMWYLWARQIIRNLGGRNTLKMAGFG